MRHRQ